MTRPSHQPPAGGTEIVKQVLSTIVLLELGGGWYGATYPGFAEVGQYRIVVYAKDDDGLEAQPVTIGLQVGYAVYLPLVLR